MICEPCRERADRLPNRFAPPELRQGCGESCGTNGCTCLHRGGTTGLPRQSVTQAEFRQLLDAELLGLAVGTVELAEATERLRARYLYGMVLELDVPDHGHPHTITGLALLPSSDPFSVKVDVTTDGCPEEGSSEG